MWRESQLVVPTPQALLKADPYSLALDTGAGEKRNEHAQTRSFITSFSANNLGILESEEMPSGSNKCLARFALNDTVIRKD